MSDDFTLRVPRNTVFSIVAVILLIVVLEVLARGALWVKRTVIDPARAEQVQCENPYSELCPYEREWDTELQQIQRYDVLLGTALEPNHQGAWITTNSLGFRGDELSSDPDLVRVAFLGGSAVMGAGNADDESIPAFTEQLAEARWSCEVEVINTGTPGYTTAQELAMLQHKVIPLEPDLIIVVDGRNDVFFATSPRWDPLYSPPLQEANAILSGEADPDPLPARIWNSLRRVSVIMNTLHQLSLQVRGVYGGLTPEQIDALALNPAVFDVYAYNVEQMAYLAQANDIPMALVVQPVLGAGERSLNPEEAEIWERRQLRGYPQIVAAAYPDLVEAAFTVGAEIPVLDYSQVFNDVTETVYSDDVHLNALGNSIVAEALLEDLGPLFEQAGCTP